MSVETLGTETGLIIAVQAQPGARRNGISGIHNRRLKVAVTQVAEKGKANKEILKQLAKALGVSKSQLKIVSGLTNSQKMIEISNYNQEQFQQFLKSLSLKS